MAHFNQCSGLINQEILQQAREAYTGIIENGENPLDKMIEMQRSLQVRLATDKPEMNQNPNELKTAGNVVDWMRSQKDCIDDEFRELLTSLGGMSTGENNASGVWKSWKSNNLQKRNTLISDLSIEDQLEIKFEMIDLVHFYLNQLMALGIDGSELFELYYIKNAENFARQDRNY